MKVSAKKIETQRNDAEDSNGGSRMTELAYRSIRSRILDNEWSPGYQATEQELALQLGMSRTPVREACMRLQQEGLVTVVPRHGMRVLPVSQTDMREIYEVLASLEATAAELVAARKLGNREIKPLEEATEAMEAALRVDDLVAWAKADERFHSNLLELCDNKILKSMVLNVWDRAHRVRMLTLRMRPKPVSSTKEHKALVKAIKDGDVMQAGRAHRAHRDRAGQELLALLQRLGLNQL